MNDFSGDGWKEAIIASREKMTFFVSNFCRMDCSFAGPRRQEWEVGAIGDTIPAVLQRQTAFAPPTHGTLAAQTSLPHPRMSEPR